DIAAGAVETRNQPELDRVAADAEDNRRAARCCFSSHDGRLTAACDDDCNLLREEFRCQLRQTIVLAVCPAVFNVYILPVDVASVPKALQKTTHIRCKGIGLCAVEEAHYGHRVLRARRKRPTGSGGERSDESAA